MINTENVRACLTDPLNAVDWTPAGFGLYVPAHLYGLADVVHRNGEFHISVRMEFATIVEEVPIDRHEIALKSVEFTQHIIYGSITSDFLRKVPIGRIQNEVMTIALAAESESGRLFPAAFISVPSYVRDKWPDSIDGEILQYVGTVYRAAQFLGLGPTAEIAKRFGVSRATAGRMVDAARREKWIDLTVGSKFPDGSEETRHHYQWLERIINTAGVPDASVPANAPDYGDPAILGKVFSQLQASGHEWRLRDGVDSEEA